MASRLQAAFAVVAAGFAAALLLSTAAYAEVSSNVTDIAVSVSATCAGPPGAFFTITGPDGKTFTVNTLESDTAGFETAGRPRGTYRFTALCLNGTSAGSGSFVIAPAGGPGGGDGGKAIEATGFLTAGLLLLGAAACGAILLRRRTVIVRR